ncbi:DUF1963 domain-containing protein [Flavobacterium sp. JLP]|uniref:DUF1963 domain-containing protein n=1 Tax=Flavobacterium sp. JLP TaxID=2783793 RepID=UPI00188DBE96|nr:DUF1963 domain-containing protein [Flavobacterium sp. JLP]MBF4507342.1 DUF1963 domain-containing protein [Flavobacterium sp. JLP]
MNGKQIVRLTETIRFVSILLLVYWIYDYKMNHGLGIAATFYHVILGVLILMNGILVHLIIKNQTSMFESHNKNVNRERVRYLTKILIFPLLAVILYGTNYYTKFQLELSDSSELPLYPDYQMTNQPVESNKVVNKDSMYAIIEKYKKSTILLQSRNLQREISWKESKFGGYPNMESFSEYPKCDVCKSSLNFVFQLYKKDFPEFYFPGDANIFQLFRCPNYNCNESFSDRYDQKMFHYYSKVDCKKNKVFVKLKNVGDLIEPEVPDCYLKSLVTSDYPKFDDYKSSDWAKLDNNFKESLLEESVEKYVTKSYTKIGGYPSFTQSSYYPKCNCGKIKEFLFQLSSDSSKKANLGIMIGDAGNIYYYICSHCGEKSIESYWDCS